MALRQLCKETGRRPVKALFFFPDENMTGIAPTRLVVEKDLELRGGRKVTVNWSGRKVHAEILALNDDEKMLSLKDIQWSKENLAENSDEQEPELVASDAEEDKENVEPPRKKPSHSNKVTKGKEQEKMGEKKRKGKNSRKGCNVLRVAGQNNTAMPQTDSRQPIPIPVMEAEETPDDSDPDEMVPPTPFPITETPMGQGSFLSDLFEDFPSYTANKKLDKILENQKVLFSLMSNLLYQTSGFQGFHQGEQNLYHGRDQSLHLGRDQSFDQGRDQNLPQGRDQNLSQGRDQSFDQGRDQNLPQGRVQSFDHGRDQSSHLGRDQSSHLGRDQSLHLGRDQSLSQGRDQSLHLGRDQSLYQGRDQSFAQGRDQSLPEGRDQSLPEGMDQTGEEENEDRFLPQVIKIKGESCSAGNFSVKLVQALFSPEELVDRNCTGRRGKARLEPYKLGKVKNYVIKMYPIQPLQREQQWKKCIIAIDEYLRRNKRGAAIQHQA